MSFQVALLTAIGEYLDTQGVGKWSLSGTYTATDVPIHFDVLPSTPDRALAISLYPVDDSLGTDSTIGLQLMARGRANNRQDTKNTLDAADDALHGLQRMTWGGAEIVLILRRSGANIGTDGNNRMESTANYYLQYTRTTQHRTDS